MSRALAALGARPWRCTWLSAGTSINSVALGLQGLTGPGGGLLEAALVLVRRASTAFHGLSASRQRSRRAWKSCPYPGVTCSGTYFHAAAHASRSTPKGLACGGQHRCSGRKAPALARRRERSTNAVRHGQSPFSPQSERYITAFAPGESPDRAALANRRVRCRTQGRSRKGQRIARYDAFGGRCWPCCWPSGLAGVLAGFGGWGRARAGACILLRIAHARYGGPQLNADLSGDVAGDDHRDLGRSVLSHKPQGGGGLVILRGLGPGIAVGGNL